MLAIPEWKGFVHNPLNKSNCLNYMGESWTSKHTLLPAGFTLILRRVLRDPGRTVQLYVDRAFEKMIAKVRMSKTMAYHQPDYM